MTISTAVLSDRDVVLAALPTLRKQMPELLQQPGSATSIARELGLPRQKVNYHLRQLEEHGLVHFVGEKQRRGITEHIFLAAADRVLIDPELLGGDSAEPGDNYAAERLAATAAPAVHDIGELVRAAARSEQELATFTSTQN